MSLLERLGIAVPVIGAGMGGGLSAAPLTIASGRAGGMGQIGILPPGVLRGRSRPIAKPATPDHTP